MTTLQMVLSIIGSFLAILTTAVIFIKWSVKKVNEKLDKKIDDRLNKFETKMFEKIDMLCVAIQEVKDQLNEDEKCRLRDNILMFAQNLRNTPEIENVSENVFNNIFADYDKYKGLKGNSFVDNEMEYIKKMHKQKDNFNIVGHKKK